MPRIDLPRIDLPRIDLPRRIDMPRRINIAKPLLNILCLFGRRVGNPLHTRDYCFRRHPPRGSIPYEESDVEFTVVGVAVHMFRAAFPSVPSEALATSPSREESACSAQGSYIWSSDMPSPMSLMNSSSSISYHRPSSSSRTGLKNRDCVSRNRSRATL